LGDGDADALWHYSPVARAVPRYRRNPLPGNADPTFPHDHSPIDERRLYVDGTAARYADQIVWATIATLNGLPATTLPVARNPEGLPIGVQLIGAFLEDRTTIALAGMIERELGCAFTPPPGY